jgi:Ser/Thr protein kinase RdoA (MazF antagonist)
MKAAWGEDQTRYFFELTPDRVLDAVESSGLVCSGRCQSLNSFENRVYDVELEVDVESGSPARHPSENHRVVKFYRPGRWNEAQILEEHQFLADLVADEIPAIAPLSFPDGKTLHQMKESGIWYTVFPKVGGRAPDELSDEQLMRIGRLSARIHNVGAKRQAEHRLKLDPNTYGLANLEFLLQGNWIPLEFQGKYEKLVREICRISEPLFAATPVQRVHGDCHLGNLLWNQSGPFFLDFDDMIRAPVVQDLWLLLPGRDSEAIRQREVFLEAYCEMRAFDRAQLKLIEPLRALRFIHYTSWVARRWQDPAFPPAFPEFNTHQYWADETQDLQEQLRLISETCGEAI